MKLEVGMYVRTNTGIRRVVYINDGCITFDDFMSNGTSLFNFIEEKELDMYLTKEPSYRIIDLVEEGDYVNGHLVTKISKDGIIWLEGYEKDGMWTYVDFINEWGDRIKSIVTKEQFKANEYVIEK